MRIGGWEAALEKDPTLLEDTCSLFAETRLWNRSHALFGLTQHPRIQEALRQGGGDKSHPIRMALIDAIYCKDLDTQFATFTAARKHNKRAADRRRAAHAGEKDKAKPTAERARIAAMLGHLRAVAHGEEVYSVPRGAVLELMTTRMQHRAVGPPLVQRNLHLDAGLHAKCLGIGLLGKRGRGRDLHQHC